ncbi:hypothetical protein K3495_g10729 [Podosphaera aphanis]|nr:hypothetical protein K3495_g10729 [Podosphaera aphanis]
MKLSLLGFKRSEYDHCIYVHPKFQLLISIYVDDLIICGRKIAQVIEIKEKLSSYFSIKDLGLIDTIIGWKIVRERATRTLVIWRDVYLIEKFKSFGLENAKTCTSPMDGYDGILPGRDEDELADESAYASAIGSLGYASNSTRQA